MTFRILFFADQAFFNIVKRSLFQFKELPMDQQKEQEAEDSAACYVCCHAAIEAFLNIVGRDVVSDFPVFESANIEGKIKILSQMNSVTIDWGKGPWQDIKCIIKVRNWLTHFKNPDIGLINSMGEWVVDSYNTKPVIDDSKVLKISRVASHYNNTRIALHQLSSWFNRDGEYDYLLTEEYESYLVG